MGNKSSREQWAGRERLLFIERLAWWKGVVNRADLRNVFGISAAQASADLQGYQEMNPTALVYNVRRKRYEAGEGMVCVMHEPKIEQAVSLFLGGAAPVMGMAGSMGAGAMVDFFRPLTREADAVVQRRVFLAMEGGRKIRVKYWSVSSSGGRDRDIAPHALGHDGYRWHVRAWCFENEDFRDFVLSRMEGAEWPEEVFSPVLSDTQWESMETVILQPHTGLDEDQRKTIIRDYGMKGGVLKVQVRTAMKEYFLAHWRVPVEGRPLHLEISGPKS
ncbi:helix-turn-helix transcriptional regulator [Luteolibacter sp. AS25]|uniref:helix-turn-helix transcriptional regulator n=1 Tax=Luteolibacter sp. AS25 TaxID=3135776 RepID=UPI00398B8818